MKKVIPLRPGCMVTEEDMQELRTTGIDNEALVILYNSTHDLIQKLLIEELATVRKISLAVPPARA